MSWFPGWLSESDLRVALAANPVVEWYLRHKCPPLNQWLDSVLREKPDINIISRSEVRDAEVHILKSITDLLVYVVDPAVYDSQPFLNWEPEEMLSLVDFTDQTVIDVGAGTGKLSLLAANKARSVFAVEPVTNLRRYLVRKARSLNIHNIYPMDGLITDIPFPDKFADITLAGHVFGDDLDLEYKELVRVTKTKGTVILCPGNNDEDNQTHTFLVNQGFNWSRFDEPSDGMKRKYWKTIT